MRKSIKGKWNKDNITKLLETNDNAVMKALITIYNLQTDEEQRAYASVNGRNRVGFDRIDAKSLTNLARKCISQKGLKKNEIEFVRYFIKKYWRQLANIANMKEAKRIEREMQIEVQQSLLVG